MFNGHVYIYIHVIVERMILTHCTMYIYMYMYLMDDLLTFSEVHVHVSFILKGYNYTWFLYDSILIVFVYAKPSCMGCFSGTSHLVL